VIRVTADSNIYISALIFGGKPLTLLEMALDGEIELAISDAILDETLRVMREKFKRNAEQLKQAEGYIAAITRRVSPTETIDAVPSDPDDNRILECAVAAGSEVIVSGDADLLRLGGYGSIKIMRVAEFAVGLRGR
jgi:putative PIN family toxin of toxin-antitoxin system